MPNHCENDLYVSGPKEDVDAFLAFIGADQSPPRFDFNSVLPYPADFAERDDSMAALQKELGWQKGRVAFEAKYGVGAKDGYNDGGYEWCRANWGTKWNAYEVVRRDYSGVCVTFQTAWSPPRPVIAELHRRFPTLTLSLEFFEQGCAFSGGVIFAPNGEYDDVDRSPGTATREWQHDGYHGGRGG